MELAVTGDFSAAARLQALAAACETNGLDPSDAQLLRLGENAIYRLAHDPVVVRISRGDLEVARKEVNVSRWLAEHDFPAARLVPGLTQPLAIDGKVATFWEFIEESDDPVDVLDLAHVMHDLHALPAPTSFDLPAFDPLPRTEQRISAAAGPATDADEEFLRNRHDALVAGFAELEFALPAGPIHADAHTGNLMRDRAGVVRLIDFEVFAWGPREWDVAILGMRYQRLGWITKHEYRRCVDIYGFDITTWPGFPVLWGIRELNMTTWLLQNAGDSAALADEFRKRIADLRHDRPPRDWCAF